MTARFPLATTTWDDTEYDALQRVIASGMFSMGPEVAAFEREFASFFRSKYAVMVNSGSSANLLMTAALFYAQNLDLRLRTGDEVLVPAVSWSTTYYPLSQYGLNLKFVDIDRETLNYDLDALEAAVSDRTRAIMIVNLLGNPNDFDRITKIVNGRKIFASLAGAADYYGVLCTLDKPGATQRDALYLAVDRNLPGVTVSGDWDPLGMRGTVSRNLLFEDVFVPEAERLMPEGMYAQAALRWPHMFATLSPTYMGIAQAAYDFTVQYLRAEVPGMPPVKRRMYPTKQIAVAEMKVKLEQTRAIFLQNARAARVDPSKEIRLGLLAAHYTIMENANDICRLAVRTCGGQSMLKTLPLERMYRDSRCGSLMLPWTAELCIDRLGRECLYEAGERDEPDVL